jgi:hypothetical protein
MDDNRILFTLQDGKVTISFDKQIPVPEFLQIISTGILASLNSIVNAAPEEIKQSTKEELYDLYNAAASNTLSYFAPEIEMRPHLTTEAILKAENEIIDKDFKVTANRAARRTMRKKEKAFQTIKGGKS